MEKLAPNEADVFGRYAEAKNNWGEKWDIAMAAVFLASDAGNQLCFPA